ncbi:TIGR04222 domain-containing membrane protein [Porphyrobacter sp. CACIAM 03H1]|uniref:TIGR04222 domain-containing membrane protein n=1 Tax=Porphyrobacter sp. CACIAM 03H1 TaxID=2003315 RepID=UPI0012FE01C2|nr:TIGR04222 domain-containing membrane protein [Porphyrobacter sp. CACIAM 03H1]
MQLFSSWTGSDFLLLYAMLLAFACLAAWWIPARLREPGRRGSIDDLESIAVLAGGRARFADTLLADLFVRGALEPAGKGKLGVAARDLTVPPAGQALLAHDAPLTLGEAVKLLATHADRVAARLQRAGLLMRGGADTRLRWLSIAPFLFLLVLGIYRHRAGSALGEPTEFLSVLLVLTAVLAVIRYAKSDPRTAAGIAVVRELRAKNGRFSRAPRAEEAAMAVALFGTGVLVGTPWEPVHAMRQKESDGGSDSSSDGGSGCGGGCGGCGG